MVLDGVLVLVFLLCGYLGWRRGVLRPLVRFGLSIVSLVVSVFAGKALAIALDKKWGWSKPLGKLFGKGSINSVLDRFSGNKGLFLLTLIMIVSVYLIVRIIFWVILRFGFKFKLKNKAENRTDKILGIFFGYAICFFNFCILFSVLAVVSDVPGISNAVDWLLKGSHIGKGLSDISLKIITPILTSIENAIIKQVTD